MELQLSIRAAHRRTCRMSPALVSDVLPWSGSSTLVCAATLVTRCSAAWCVRGRFCGGDWRLPPPPSRPPSPPSPPHALDPPGGAPAASPPLPPLEVLRFGRSVPAPRPATVARKVARKRDSGTRRCARTPKKWLATPPTTVPCPMTMGGRPLSSANARRRRASQRVVTNGLTASTTSYLQCNAAGRQQAIATRTYYASVTE